MASWRAAIVGGLLSSFVGMAGAATDVEWGECSGADPDRSLTACTRIINDGATIPSDRADAFLYRGGSHLTKGDAEAAIADYGEAIRLNPGNVTGFSSRAIAQFRKGNRDAAILDFSVARRINPGAADEMAGASEELKQIAEAARTSPPPQSRIDAMIAGFSPAPAAPPPAAVTAPPPAASPPPATATPPAAERKAKKREPKVARTGGHCKMISEEPCYPQCSLKVRQDNMRRWNRCMSGKGVPALPVPTQ